MTITLARFTGSTHFAACMLFPALLVIADVSCAATFTVGNEPGCTHSNVQSAINAASGTGPHLIKIKTMVFSAQAINVSGKDITLTGGYLSCAAASSTARSTLSGAGGSAGSVFGVTGSGNDVILENLSIVAGDEVVGGSGGGVDFRGNGFLTLRNSVISDNYAGTGGGIFFSGEGELRIEAGTLIVRNIAQYSGGGVFLAGNARMAMTQDGTAIQSNIATEGDGGGIAVAAPARASIGSPGFGNTGAIFDNTARHGGGVAVLGSGDEDVFVNLFSANAGAPLRVHGNRARQDGGGIYLKPYSGNLDRSAPYLTASNVTIESNRAAQGSALYLGTDFPSHADIVDVRINDNINEDIDGQPTPGATVLLHELSQLDATRVEFRRNIGAQVLRMLGDFTDTTLNDCLIVSNDVTQQLLWQEGGGDSNSLNLDHCTVAANSIGATHVVSSSHDFRLLRSIIDQPGKTSLVFGGGVRYVDDVIASETFSLGSISSILPLAPRFIDPAHGDFHLQAASPAVDYSGVLAGTDLDGAMRGRELAIVPNRFGAGDIGAYERLEIGNLVLNRGFAEDLRLWDVVRPGVTSWNSVGLNSTGSAHVSYTRSDIGMPAAGILVGISQCIHIPGPGSYRLTGFAHGDGSGVNRDKVSLRWAFRANTGSEACGGAITSEGIVGFPNAASFVAPTADAIIDVPTSVWTNYSSVVVSLAVVEGSLELLATTSGHFDGIVLEPILALADDVFANGFE